MTTGTKSYPAIDVRPSSPDLTLALVDDFGPTAVEERDDVLRIFFPTTAARDEALRALAAPEAMSAMSAISAISAASPVDVPDDDWARRSQENLQPLTVGGITIFPNPESQIPNLDGIGVVIQPSMGFGTGHHATTRLCLAALQEVDLRGAFVLDVGTGSGVLAIAAARLGASRALGIDCDPDAIQSARENLKLNADIRHVEFEVTDLTAQGLPAADIVTANLTSALLVRSAAALLAAVRPFGTLIASGFLTAERAEVQGCLTRLTPVRLIWEREEEGWVGLAFNLDADLRV